MRSTVLAVRFVLELCLLAALAVGGSELGGGGLLGAVVGVAAVLAAAGAWGMWVGPRSARRLADPWRLVLEIGLFALAGLGLWLGWSAGAGLALALVSTVVAVLTRRVGEPVPPRGQ
jgi:hypothetical protein